MEDVFESLQREYCPPLDTALLSAILLDHELSNEQSLAEARQTLDALRVSAASDGAVDFDPSGTSGMDNGSETDDGHQHENFVPRDLQQLSTDTDLTSVSSDLQSHYTTESSDLEKSNKGGTDDHLALFELLSVEQKAERLQEMFPSMTAFSISHTLQKCDFNCTRAMEELLNQEFFDSQELVDGEEKIARKGVDAFSEENIIRRGRKKQMKRNRASDRVHDPLRSSSQSSEQTSLNTSSWERAKKDVDFIVSRTSQPRSVVSSLYHQNNTSTAATLSALIEKALENFNASSESTEAVASQTNAVELAQDFPQLTHSQRLGLSILTYPSTSSMRELALALASTPVPRLAGVETIQVRLRRASLDPSPASSSEVSRSTSPAAATALQSRTSASAYYTLRDRAFEQASAAHRRGKSDRLMSAAAGYYGQVGRDLTVKAAEATAEAADALVAKQSLPGRLDLHGVSAKDSVRIAKREVEKWWKTNKGILGLDGRMTRQDSRGLEIITGVGRHSVGGKARIGPAVARMLANNGWRFQVDEGMLTVLGKG